VYQDPLGPTVDYLRDFKRKSYGQIINAAARPNGDINRTLAPFKSWLADKPDDVVRGYYDSVFDGGIDSSNKLLRQTGGGGYVDAADELYDAIRVSGTDINAIATNTGIKSPNIQKVKEHVFYNEHLLDKYVDYGVPAERSLFDSDLNQAQAWKRLEDGTHTNSDIIWLKHETAERWYELRHNSGYTEAHDAAERKWTGNPWGNK
jgi:hypothetical protein